MRLIRGRFALLYAPRQRGTLLEPEITEVTVHVSHADLVRLLRQALYKELGFGGNVDRGECTRIEIPQRLLRLSWKMN